MLENAVVNINILGYGDKNSKEKLEKITTIYILANDGETVFEFSNNGGAKI